MSKTIAATNGFCIFTDRRKEILSKDGAIVFWDSEFKQVRVNRNKKRIYNVYSDDKERNKTIGSLRVGFDLVDASGSYKIAGVIVRAFLNFVNLSSLEDCLEKIMTFINPSSKETERCVFVTDKNYIVEVGFIFDERKYEIEVYEPGTLRIYSGSNNRFCSATNAIFLNKKSDNEFTKNAFLALSCIFNGSINYDMYGDNDAFVRDIKPTLEEEKEARAIFLHPRYKENTDAKRYFD